MTNQHNINQTQDVINGLTQSFFSLKYDQYNNILYEQMFHIITCKQLKQDNGILQGQCKQHLNQYILNYPIYDQCPLCKIHHQLIKLNHLVITKPQDKCLTDFIQNFLLIMNRTMVNVPIQLTFEQDDITRLIYGFIYKNDKSVTCLKGMTGIGKTIIILKTLLHLPNFNSCWVLLRTHSQISQWEQKAKNLGLEVIIIVGKSKMMKGQQEIQFSKYLKQQKLCVILTTFSFAFNKKYYEKLINSQNSLLEKQHIVVIDEAHQLEQEVITLSTHNFNVDLDNNQEIKQLVSGIVEPQYIYANSPNHLYNLIIATQQQRDNSSKNLFFKKQGNKLLCKTYQQNITCLLSRLPIKSNAFVFMSATLNENYIKQSFINSYGYSDYRLNQIDMQQRYQSLYERNNNTQIHFFDNCDWQLKDWQDLKLQIKQRSIQICKQMNDLKSMIDICLQTCKQIGSRGLIIHLNNQTYSKTIFDMKDSLFGKDTNLILESISKDKTFNNIPTIGQFVIVIYNKGRFSLGHDLNSDVGVILCLGTPFSNPSDISRNGIHIKQKNKYIDYWKQQFDSQSDMEQELQDGDNDDDDDYYFNQQQEDSYDPYLLDFNSSDYHQQSIQPYVYHNKKMVLEEYQHNMHIDTFVQLAGRLNRQSFIHIDKKFHLFIQSRIFCQYHRQQLEIDRQNYIQKWQQFKSNLIYNN